MKCRRCNVNINGKFKRCPLCNTKLDGTYEESVFPKIEKESVLLKKIMLFASFSILVLFVFVELTATNKIKISKYIFFGLITNYILVNFIVNNYKDVLKMVNKYFWLILLLLFMWFFLTKSLAITTYVIPVLCIIILVFNSILIIVKKDYVKRYIKTILLDCAIGFIPLILNIFNLSLLPVLSNVVVVINILLFIGMIIFFFDYIVDEIKKIFSI